MRLILVLCLAFALPTVWAAQYTQHSVEGQTLHISTDEGKLSLTFYQNDVVEAFYQPEGVKQLPSFSISQRAEATPASLIEQPNQLLWQSGSLQVQVQKAPLKLSYYRDGKLLLSEKAGYIQQGDQHGFSFALSDGEKLLGGGERVLGMDRRGQTFPLYNKAHYGYSTASSQMYFSLPLLLSSNKYMLLFDNSAKGEADLGATVADELRFTAEGGRSSYVVVAGGNYPALLQNYTALTGRQPLPARWTLGNYASRFGYHSEAEARAVVEKFRELKLPLDALVLDLYWFGPDIKGHMGNLAWDLNAFPQPEKMLADFSEDGINTILVTEPFVLTTSKRWQEAVDAGAIAKDLTGQPKTFDFYFGNTGLIDVFSQQGRDWFWPIYQGLAEQGVAGVWGDLGEPEVHPEDTVHANGMANEVHNAFGHKWADMVYSGMRQHFPDQRPFIMMRAGAPGSQRFGMVPWTGDVERSWGGLKPQVELALTMGLSGFGYIHSDLGGFAGGEQFDKELYIRWLQYGVFQPVYRPHAQEHIAPELVFHDSHTIETLRPWLNLRYQLLPYNYTLAYQNSLTGMPLMRPLFFYKDSFAACLALLLVSVIAIVNLSSNLNNYKEQVAQLQSSNQNFANQVNYLDKQVEIGNQAIGVYTNPDNKFVNLAGTPNSPDAKLIIAFNPKEQKVSLDLKSMKMPVTDAEHQYQLWALVDGVPVDLGVFDAEGNGIGFKDMKSIGKAQAFAVTLEPKGGSKNPTLDQMVVMGAI